MLIKFIMLAISFILILFQPAIAFSLEKDAYFAGGCFWCLEHDLEGIPGVVSAESGYLGGDLLRPNYEKHNGHKESVSVKYNPAKVTYMDLLRAYWRNIDPFDNEGQFCDRGDSYKPIIFLKDKNEKHLIEESFQKAAIELGVPQVDLKVEVAPFKTFWPAEGYHQDFAKKNSLKYSVYRFSCGRDYRLDQVWGEQARTTAPWQTDKL